MGTCTSDIYKTAKRQYGETFQKFIIQHQSLAKLKEWIRGREQQFDAKLESKKGSLNKEVDQREQLLNNNFSQSKLSLQSQLPYGVGSFQQMRKSSLQNLLGLNEYKKKFQHARSLIKSQSSKRKENFHNKSEQILKKFEGQGKIDEQKLKTFHDLPQEKRKFIFEKGVKEFEVQINTKIAQLQNLNGNELNFDGELKILENTVSLKELDDTVNRSKNQFKTDIANIIGSNLDSSIQV